MSSRYQNYGPHTQGKMPFGGRPTPGVDIPAGATKPCDNCGTEVSVQLSRFNKNYYTEIRLIGGQKVTKRNLFHNCPVAQKQHKQFAVEGIYKLFETAKAHLKYPKIHLLKPGKQMPLKGTGTYIKPEDEVVLSVASAKSRYAGRIMVTDGRKYMNGNTFYGSIDPLGKFHQNPAAGPEVLQLLSELSADPAGVAKKFGMLTGRCCFCNRPLDDERSTAVGYGPVCADHYGLPWGAAPAAPMAPITKPAIVPGTQLYQLGFRDPVIEKKGAWVNTSENVYIAEDSEMKLNGETACPKCGQPTIGEQGLWTAVREKASGEIGDISFWKATHSCGAQLCILND